LVWCKAGELRASREDIVKNRPRGGTVKREDRVSRRTFLSGAASALAFSIVPRRVLGGGGYVAPSDKLTLASIGVGAQGTRVMMDFLKLPQVQVIAVCDVNRQSSDYSEWGTNELRDKVRAVLGDPGWGSKLTGPTAGRDPARAIVEAYYATQNASGAYHGCTAYSDFREALHQEKDLDGVVVCTPDHWHAPISIMAMKMGKHVYCQKPMSHSAVEARRMAEVARQTKVATQVAVANSASSITRILQEWMMARAVGPVHRVENWSSRPFWPQGLDRPDRADPVPEGFDWDLWLGPAPERPFSHVYLPFVWRGWYDFGNGALGDMGQYSFDTIFRMLKLTAPTTVEASSTKLFKESFPAASLIHWEFPGRGGMPPVQINWYDGGIKPPRPDELEDGRDFGVENEGLLVVGDLGMIMAGFEGDHPQILPDSRKKSFVPPPRMLRRSPGHYQEWILAAKGGPPAAANFEFEAPIGEALMLGNIALRTGERLRWDSENFKVTNSSAAQAMLDLEYRGDWGSVIKGV
jgi:predicted dehydrogenase